jgi:hypothetical protein
LTMTAAAQHRQAYTLAPVVRSGNWNPFTVDRSIISIYPCELSSHSTDIVQVANLRLETRISATQTMNYSYHSSTWAQAQRMNSRLPGSATRNSHWSDSNTLQARINMTNGEIWCAGCLDAKNTQGFGTGAGPTAWITES